MTRKASTAPAATAKRVPIGGVMGRVMFFLVLLVLVLAGIGFLALGAFPPEPHALPVHKLLPNDRFIRGP